MTLIYALKIACRHACTEKFYILRYMAETVFFLIDLYTRHHMPQNNFSCKCIYSQAGNNVPDRLANAYGSFRRWCKNMHATPAVKHFTKENLGWTSMAKFPDCSFKGGDTRLLLGWLLNFMEEPNVVLDEVATNACVAAKAIDDFLRLCFGNKDAQGCRKILLTQEEAILCLSMLKVYLDQFTFLARTCFNQAKQFFNYTPKFHYLMHVAFDLEQQILRSGKDEKIMSPACFATQMAEDATGRSCRIARTCHPNTTSLRVAQKWLITCKLAWDNT